MPSLMPALGMKCKKPSEAAQRCRNPLGHVRMRFKRACQLAKEKLQVGSCMCMCMLP